MTENDVNQHGAAKLPLFTLAENDNLNIIIGCSGKGKSSLVQMLAEREGITYEQAEQLCQPTTEQLEIEEKIMEEKQNISSIRLQKVRDAYWSATAADDNEFWAINDCCNEFLGIDPTPIQVKAIFDALPQSIIGRGISWGFSDTEVSDAIYVYISDNATQLKTLLEI